MFLLHKNLTDCSRYLVGVQREPKLLKLVFLLAIDHGICKITPLRSALSGINGSFGGNRS